MYCSQCGSKINKGDNFCENCGDRNYGVKSVNNNSSNVDNRKFIYFTLIRSGIEFLANLIIFVTLFISLSDNMFFVAEIGAIILSVVVYLLLSIFFNRKVKLEGFSKYLLSNIFSLILYFIVSLIVFYIWTDIVKVVGEFYAEGYAFLAIILFTLNAFSCPIMFVINLIMDLVNVKFKKKN